MDHCLLSMFRNNVFFLIYLWYLLIISSRVINLICLASSVRWGWLRNCFHIVLDNVNTILCEKECNKLLTSCLYHKNLTSVIFFFVTQSILAILLSLTRNRIHKNPNRIMFRNSLGELIISFFISNWYIDYIYIDVWIKL